MRITKVLIFQGVLEEVIIGMITNLKRVYYNICGLGISRMPGTDGLKRIQRYNIIFKKMQVFSELFFYKIRVAVSYNSDNNSYSRNFQR